LRRQFQQRAIADPACLLKRIHLVYPGVQRLVYLVANADKARHVGGSLWQPGQQAGAGQFIRQALADLRLEVSPCGLELLDACLCIGDLRHARRTGSLAQYELHQRLPALKVRQLLRGLADAPCVGVVYRCPAGDDAEVVQNHGGEATNAGHDVAESLRRGEP